MHAAARRQTPVSETELHTHKLRQARRGHPSARVLERVQLVAPLRKRLEATVGDRCASRDVEALEIDTVRGKERERGVGHSATLSHAQRAKVRAAPGEGAHSSVGDKSAAAEGKMLEVRAGAGHSPARKLAASLELHRRQVSA